VSGQQFPFFLSLFNHYFFNRDLFLKQARNFDQFYLFVCPRGINMTWRFKVYKTKESAQGVGFLLKSEVISASIEPEKRCLSKLLNPAKQPLTTTPDNN